MFATDGGDETASVDGAIGIELAGAIGVKGLQQRPSVFASKGIVIPNQGIFALTAHGADVGVTASLKINGVAVKLTVSADPLYGGGILTFPGKYIGTIGTEGTDVWATGTRKGPRNI